MGLLTRIHIIRLPNNGKWPTWPQWRQLPKVLTKKERYGAIALSLGTLFFGVATLWMVYVEHTTVVPTHGGTYTEALVGEPQFINPIFAGINDVDKDLTALVYSGLMKYDTEGHIVPDLAERYDVSADGKTYMFFLRKNVLWHDGETLNADDVVFTFTTLLDPRYGSPQRAGLQGTTVEKVDDFTVKMTFPYPHTQFLDKLTVGIVPKHIWESISPQNSSLANANLEPIGSGPYHFVKFTKDKYGSIISFSLAANAHFYNGAPFIDAITFYFYQSDDEALKAYRDGTVMGIGGIAPKDKDAIGKWNARVYTFATPKYFAVFFNQSRSKPLADAHVREALWRATDRDAIVRDVLGGNGMVVNSPILPWLSGFNPDITGYPYSEKDAGAALDAAGWKDKNNDGVREKTIGKEKTATNLEITLLTSDSPELLRTQELLRNQWTKIGVKVNIDNYTVDELKQTIIKPRKYEALIFGEAMTQYPDPYLFWHSSQKKDPGLNLALYDNKDADQLLEKARDAAAQSDRDTLMKKFQSTLANDIPALFLYSPSYLYAVSNSVHNIATTTVSTPARRFAGIEHWYIATHRALKTRY